MGAKPNSFKRKLLASSISSCLFASAGAYAQVQERSASDSPTVMEEVQVLGIRQSLERAMDIKRESTGVVEAISSEDIGKMPDQNLAESLQRVSGLSINRTNGEGSEVTARGIDARYNMVTLNGRIMPAVSNRGEIGDQATRAFDFANIASEGVSGIEVYKTGRADITTGGLGATVNIVTNKPLDAGETKLVVGAKAVHDTTVTRGDGSRVTPEVSGLFTWLNEEDTFGVSVVGAYQVRDNSRSRAFVNQWQPRVWGNGVIPYQAYALRSDDGDVLTPAGGVYTPMRNEEGQIIDGNGERYTPVAGVDFAVNPAANVPADGQLLNLPTDLRYVLEDNTRTRTNGQLTMQFRPVETLTATLDYTYSENKLAADRAQQSTWFGVANITEVVFDNNEVRTPILYSESYPDSFKDIAFAQQIFEAATQNDSVGFNLLFEPSDNMRFSLDYHDSSAVNILDRSEAGMAAQVAITQRVRFDQDLPVMGVEIDDSATSNDRRSPLTDRQLFDLRYEQNRYLEAGGTSTEDEAYKAIAAREEFLGERYQSGNANGVLDAGDISTTIGQFNRAEQRTDIRQLQLDAQISFDDFAFFSESGVDFGVEVRKDQNNTKVAQNRVTMGNWGGVDPDRFDNSYFTARDFADGFPDFGLSTGHPWFLNEGLEADPNQLFKLAEWMNIDPNVRDPNNFSNFVAGQAKWNGQYQQNRTIQEEVKSAYVQFQGRFDVADMDAGLVVGVKYEETDVTSISDVVPPTNLVWESDDDWNVAFGSAAITRVGYGSYDNILPNIDFDISPVEDVKVRLSYSTTIARAEYNRLSSSANLDTPYVRRIASEGDPNLLPMESDNLDLSVEWYYTEDSYMSAGVFRKDVTNFIGDRVEPRRHYGLTDPLLTQTYLDIIASGIAPNTEEAFLAFAEARGFANPTQASVDIPALPGDPVAVFDTTVPTNNKDAVINGFELALQHWFGESGFGFQTNATIVNADVEFDNTATTEQFAMIGLSNSANLIGFFENDDWQVRVAYNWRDKFLNNTTYGGGNEPSYTEAFAQIDFSVGYNVNDYLTFTLEGLNVTGEDSRQHGRSVNQMQNLEDLGARYAAGVRFTY